MQNNTRKDQAHHLLQKSIMESTYEENGYKQVIVLRKDLNMRKGKMVAQGAHASMSVLLQRLEDQGATLVLAHDERLWPWLTGRFKKVVVSVSSEEELLSIHKQAQDKNVLCSLIRDAGLTEFAGVPTYTAVAVGPDKEEHINAITGHLPLL